MRVVAEWGGWGWVGVGGGGWGWVGVGGWVGWVGMGGDGWGGWLGAIVPAVGADIGLLP